MYKHTCPPKERLSKQALALRTTVFLILAALIILIQPSFVSAQASPEATVYTDRAVLAYDAKRYNEALKELKEALRLNPKSVDALYYHGLVLLALKRPSEALASLENALKLRPGDVDVTFQLGVLYFNQKDYEKAKPLLQQVYRASPKRPNIGYYLGFMEYRNKNYRAAIKFFRANVPSDKNFAQLARFYTGLAVGALGFAKQARAEIEEALRLQPVSPLTKPAQRFGEVLQRRAEEERFFRGELRFGVYYDTNVPVIPNVSSDIVGQAIRAGQQRRKSEGEIASLDLSYTWLKTPPSHPNGEWEGTISHRFFQAYNNHLPKFNAQSHTPTISVVNRGSVPTRWGDLPYFAGLQYTYDFITLANSRFVQRFIVNPYFTLVEKSFKVPLGSGIKVDNITNLQFRFQQKDFFNDSEVVRREQRDAQNYMIGPTHFFLFEGGRHYLKIGYQYDYENAEGQNWTYWGSRAVVGMQYTLPKKWWDIRLRYELDYHWRYHKNKHSLLPATSINTKKRRDREAVHFVSIAKDFTTDFAKSFPFTSCSQGRCPFTISVDYLFDDNDSNLKPFDYERHVVTTSITWRFDSSAFASLAQWAAAPAP